MLWPTDAFTYASNNLKLQHPPFNIPLFLPRAHLPSQIPAHQGKDCIQNAPPSVFVEGKIRDLPIDRTLKPRP